MSRAPVDDEFSDLKNWKLHMKTGQRGCCFSLLLFLHTPNLPSIWYTIVIIVQHVSINLSIFAGDACRVRRCVEKHRKFLNLFQTHTHTLGFRLIENYFNLSQNLCEISASSCTVAMDTAQWDNVWNFSRHIKYPRTRNICVQFVSRFLRREMKQYARWWVDEKFQLSRDWWDFIYSSFLSFFNSH